MEKTMSTFIVNGGKSLTGVYRVSGAKNAAPKLLITALLSKDPCTFHNIPQFSDTFRSIETLTAIGGSVRFLSKHSVEVKCENIYSSEIPLEAMSARQAVLFIGASLARTGRVTIYPPKGDAIGKRPLNRHLEGIQALGGTIYHSGQRMEIIMPQRPRSTTYRFEKTTHCGTENLILASVFNQGIVVLENAAQEPEVDNLIQGLNMMGARIRRSSSRTIEIIGVEPFLHGAEITSMFDRIESATAIVLSAMTGGSVAVANAPKKLIEPFTKFCEDIGINLVWDGDTVRITSMSLPLKSTTIITDCAPGFMTDWQPLATLLLAHLSQGKSMIHERIYETRWRYLTELSKMGVRYELFQPEGFGPKDYYFNDSEYSEQDPHAAYVWGPTELKAAELQSHDVRGGIDMLLAAMAANGQSIISDPNNHIDRGYENIVEKCVSLGADITRV